MLNATMTGVRDMALIHTISMAAVAGVRSMTPLAAVAIAARTGLLSADNGALGLVTRRFVSVGTLALAAGELAGDRMESAPARTVPAGMAARIAPAAIAGAPAPRRQRGIASILGASAAVAAAYLSLDLRRRAMQRHGPTATGLVDDAIAVASAALIAHSAVRK